MKHLPPRVVLDARHYHALGVTVAELARLYGVRRDTLSRAVSGATHAALVEPPGFRPRLLPKRRDKPRIILAARYYARHGVPVAELARLYGVRRDTLSRAIHGHTHAALTEPDGYRPAPLPKRAPRNGLGSRRRPTGVSESLPEPTGREYALAELKGLTWTPCAQCGSIALAVGGDVWQCGTCGHRFEEGRQVPPPGPLPG